ncbi:hypothetical protein [Streptomyces fructofermentans]|uniref:Lipoprotein n=1 Tax=Streptomyces fructofermentans TaxID=152141 RepID=A0A918NBS2_9ACTN|nr:hypothetical protein [Streptomyces fructofermentans]GGX56301.1 hypothetical protein GCM10010515_24590 [Streptomyces fructofermentans]
MTGWRPALSAASCALLLAGCTGGTDDGPATGTERPPSKRAGEGGGPAPSGSPSASAPGVGEPYTLAEDRAPRTRAEAVAFVRELPVRPDHFGAGYRKRVPYETDPGGWAVLDEDCVWQREPLPKSVLASLTRRLVLPASDGRGAVRVSVTVTVHASATEARRDMAVSLEEALRCPDQRLSATERVRGLTSRADPYTEQRSVVSEDDLIELGEYLVDGSKKARTFNWFKERVGPVTVAATARLGGGRSEAEENDVTLDVAKGVSFVSAEVDRSGESDADAEGKDQAEGNEPTEQGNRAGRTDSTGRTALSTGTAGTAGTGGAGGTTGASFAPASGPPGASAAARPTGAGR